MYLEALLDYLAESEACVTHNYPLHARRRSVQRYAVDSWGYLTQQKMRRLKNTMFGEPFNEFVLKKRL